MSEHSPTPWYTVFQRGFGDNVAIFDAKGEVVLRCPPSIARMLVHTANSHDALLAALEWAMSFIHPAPGWNGSALAKYEAARTTLAECGSDLSQKGDANIPPDWAKNTMSGYGGKEPSH